MGEIFHFRIADKGELENNKADGGKYPTGENACGYIRRGAFAKHVREPALEQHPRPRPGRCGRCPPQSIAATAGGCQHQSPAFLGEKLQLSDGGLRLAGWLCKQGNENVHLVRGVRARAGSHGSYLSTEGERVRGPRFSCSWNNRRVVRDKHRDLDMPRIASPHEQTAEALENAITGTAVARTRGKYQRDQTRARGRE